VDVLVLIPFLINSY